MRDGRGAEPFRRRAGPGGDDHPRTNGTNGAHPTGDAHAPDPARPSTTELERADRPRRRAGRRRADQRAGRRAVGVGGRPRGSGADDRVAAVLAAWKAEVDAEPIPELVDVDTAVATVRRRAGRPRGTPADLAPVAAAAALIVLACGGVSVGSYSAEPDDALWPVSKVLYSERAESVEAAVRVEDHIAQAKQALSGRAAGAGRAGAAQAQRRSRGRPARAGADPAGRGAGLPRREGAGDPTGRADRPGAPLVAQPTRPVPSGAATVDPPRPSSTTLVTPSGPPVSGSSEQSSPPPRPTGRSSRRRRPSSAGSETVVPSTTLPDTTDPRTGTGTAGPGTGTGTVDPTTGADPPGTPSGPQPGPALVDPGQTPTASGTTGAGPVSTGGTGSTSTGSRRRGARRRGARPPASRAEAGRPPERDQESDSTASA